MCGAFAADEAKAVLSDSGKTMTFVYDSKLYGTKGTDWFSVEEAVAQAQTLGTRKPWYDAGAYETVTKVVFDRTFATYKPANCYQWFRNFSKLTTVAGIVNLDVSEATNLGMMFAYCSSLTTVDLAQFDTAKVTSIYAKIDKAGQAGYFTAAPVAVWSSDGTTLTFYADGAEHEGKVTFSVAEAEAQAPDDYAPWFYAWEDVTKVVFDDSFKAHQPKHCGSWFDGFSEMTAIEGIENLDTSEATSLYALFNDCNKLTSLDLGTWDTAKVTDMTSMFADCSSLQTIIVSDSFSTAAVTASDNMFSGCSALVGANKTAYSDEHTDASYAHVDAVGNPGYFTGVLAPVAVYDDAAKTLTFYYDNLGHSGEGGYLSEKPIPVEARAVFSTDGKTLTFYYDDSLHTEEGTAYSVAAAETIDPETEYAPWYAACHEAVEVVVFDSSFAAYRPKSLGAWFYNFTKLRELLNLQNLDTSDVTNMDYLFTLCKNLEVLDLPGFDTSNVTSMKGMFQYCAHLVSLDLTSFDTANVTAMQGMFGSCERLRAIYASWLFTTEGLPDVQEMFSCNEVLAGGRGTAFSDDQTDSGYARIDGGATAPGYFSETPKVGLYLVKDLQNGLGVVIPSDVDYAAGDKVTVKIEGLAKGLKLVTKSYTKKISKKKTVVVDRFLWKVTEGTNEGVMDTIDWTDDHMLVTTDAEGVSAMQGTSCNWPVAATSGAKVTASGLPTGLKLVQDKKTKAWTLSGVPTKTGNFVITFTTVVNGQTVVERRAFTVRANALAGTYCLVQEEAYEVASLSAVLTVAAGGTSKLIFTENARKWTVTAKSIEQGDVIGVGFTLPADKKAKLPARLLIADLDGQKLWLGGTVKLGKLYRPVKLSATWTEDVVITAYDKYDTDGEGSYGYLYLSATVSKKTGTVGVAGKLSDGTAIKATTYLLDFDESTGDALIAPVLVTDKKKRVLSLTIGDTSTYFVRRNGEDAAVKADLAYGEFNASELKNKKASDLCPYANACAIFVNGSLAADFTPTAKHLATKLGTGGLLKLTQKDASSVTWTLEMVPCYDGTTFWGIATGKKGKTTYTGQAMLFYQE